VTVTQALGFSVFISRILATDLKQFRCHFKSRLESFFFQAQFLSFHYSAAANSEDSNQFNFSAPKLISWQAESRNSTLHFMLLFCAPLRCRTILYNHFARTTQKTQLLLLRGVFTDPLPSNRCPIIARARMCLPSRCLVMDLYVTI
jgi:hypothetical protein